VDPLVRGVAEAVITVVLVGGAFLVQHLRGQRLPDKVWMGIGIVLMAMLVIVGPFNF
jgi:hypothetical protein